MLPETIVIRPDPRIVIEDFLRGKHYSQVGVLMDEHTKSACYPLVQPALPTHKLITVPSGEQNKSLETCSLVWQYLTDFAFDRHSLLIILGGGVLGDLGGFCAATFKRGIDFLLMPTTLLAQVDASIGGKLGIDFQNLKNHIGLFQQPVSTLISTTFLKTLPPGELRSGFAEVVKHCLISDRTMWEKVRSKSLADQSWEELIRHSVEFKYSVIARDPKENGLRKILNYGHTVGHAVEGEFLASGGPIYHGEAVAIGMMVEANIAFQKGLLTRDERDQIISYLSAVFGPFRPMGANRALLERMAQDKKNQGKRILMALPEGIGKAVWDVEVNEVQIAESLDFFRSANADH
jgi:3-dehydroquinate synthase